MKGSFAPTLHAHIPYCRKSGTWPAGEEWLFEALEETYIPLLEVLRGWKNDGIPARLTIGVVPALAEMLADDYLRRRFDEYLKDRIRRAERDARRFAGDAARREVADYWRDRYRRRLDTYHQDFYADVLGTLRWLQDEGVCEVMTSAATHGLLPLFERDSAVFAQVRVGVETYRRHFGRDSRGFWLPECAYRPAEWSRREEGNRRGIDEWLADEGIEYFVVESDGLTRGRLVENRHWEAAPTTGRGYRLPSGVAVFGRNTATGEQVWSPVIGYPADPNYLEFHRKDAESGLRYWRVTDRDSAEKAIYEPACARERIASHADHFVRLLGEETARAWQDRVEAPVVVAPYDAELFGHWWHEGVEFIDHVARRLVASDSVEPGTLGDCASGRDGFSTVELPRTTWGLNGDFTTWVSSEHAWVWPLVNAASRDLEAVLDGLARSGQPSDERGHRVVRQLARESLLMQGSDWPFLMFTGQAKEYANGRFHHHHQRFLRLLWAARDLDDHSRLSDADLAAMIDVDAAWPWLDPAIFHARG